MKFLQAHSLLKGFTSDKKQKLTLVMSGQPENLCLFIRAEYAQRGVDCQIDTIPFNTLHQYLLTPQETEVGECFLLFPWDFLPSLDWRSGINEASPSFEDTAQQLEKMNALFQQRNAHFFYIQAPIPPLFANAAENRRLEKTLLALALQLNANILPADIFSLNSYLNFGVPFASNQCGDLAEIICRDLQGLVCQPKKVLVTDLDNVMWGGVIGEDGIDGIKDKPEGEGYSHFIYQTLLRKLKHQGVLLAAVSKNDPDLALAPFQRTNSVLREEDFVTVLASYESKAAQISALVAQLNVGLDACVFVDDNPVEIAAVAQALPTVTCVTFPAKVDGLVETVAQLEQLFSTATLTDEDKQRTRLYRTRLAGMVPVASAEINLESFLRELDMVLHVFDRTTAQQERAIQLINKTNQFNLNGIRYTDAEVKDVLARGGRLLTAHLKDKHGDHGEIIACLIDRDEMLLSMVMSCRVMQRKVEQAFLGWLAAQVLRKEFISMRYLKTERNTPVQQFLAAEQFTIGDELATTPRQDFAQRQQVAMSWFTLVTQE